ELRLGRAVDSHQDGLHGPPPRRGPRWLLSAEAAQQSPRHGGRSSHLGPFRNRCGAAGPPRKACAAPGRASRGTHRSRACTDKEEPGDPMATIRYDDTRTALLAQHATLRALMEGVTEAARRASRDGAIAGPELRARLRTLDAAFKGHLVTEEALLG